MNTIKTRAHAVGRWLALAGLVACTIALVIGVVKGLAYSYPMVEGDYRAAADAPLADRAYAKYAWAIDLHKGGQNRFAKRVLSEAFNDLSSDTGIVPAENFELASDIQHLLGVVNEHEQDFRLAIAAYEESLRYNPGNMASKYNLERLKNQYPDLSKQKPDEQPGPGAGSSKKGI